MSTSTARPRGAARAALTANAWLVYAFFYAPIVLLLSVIASAQSKLEVGVVPVGATRSCGPVPVAIVIAANAARILSSSPSTSSRWRSVSLR